MNQQTLKEPIKISGIGLHSGTQSTITLHPADADNGISFKKNINGKEILLPIDRATVVSVDRCTEIEGKGIRVQTIEHLLSALVGMNIDNVIIEIDGDEIPILDGSASGFIDYINQVGVVEQKAQRLYYAPKEMISVKDDVTGAEISLIPDENFEIKTMVDYDAESIYSQMYLYNEGTDYQREVAPARTFVFLHEIMPLIEMGLAQGGTLENAVVFVEEELTDNQKKKVAEVLDNDSVDIKKGTLLNPEGLRFSNEPARHKTLDLLGDLALAGIRLKGKINAYKPGHGINSEFVKAVKASYLQHKKLRGKPLYDPNKPPVYTSEDIKSTLPHRYPFMLVDKIIELSDNYVVGVKNISSDQSYYQGHFPDNPVFPGVLQIEAMAQTGGILILSMQDEPSEWDTYFMKIDKVKFKHMVVPGDTMIMKLELLSPIRRGICHMFGTAYVGDKIVSEGELLAQIVKKSE